MAGGAPPIMPDGSEGRGTSSARSVDAVAGSGSSLSYTKNATKAPSQTHSDALMQGLNALRCAEKLFDVTLVVEDRMFRAHRVVLAACSDYFCAMFTDAMREATQSEIKLSGVTARGIELLIEYAYTSELELNSSNIQDMLSVSSHVQMKAVISACSNYLESQIDLENCAAIAALADLYSLDALKKKTYRYICSRLDEFARTPDLYNLSWDQLEYILMCNYPVDCTEERVLQIITHYCMESKIKPEFAHRILAWVRFNQIDRCALSDITCQMEAAITTTVVAAAAPPPPIATTTVATPAATAAPTSIATATATAAVAAVASPEDITRDLKRAYYQALRAEMHKQQQAARKSVDGKVLSDDDEMVCNGVLTNSRGMELALVKIGGFETNGLTNQLSCYLPTKGKWENLTVIPHIEQCNYGTAVLGNDLYIVGGSYDVCLKEYIHPFGFRYCSTRNKWRTIAPIQSDRCRFSLNAIGVNYLYAVGGVCELNESDAVEDPWGDDNNVSNCERYDASADVWEYMPSLSENRSQHAGVVQGERLYISGGIQRHSVLSSFWCFDTETEKWLKLSPMPIPRADHVLVGLNNRIYACGGWFEDVVTETRVLADTIDVYDILADEWTTETRNPMPKFYTGVAAIKGRIYYIGGLLSTATINRASSSVQCYDLDTKQWIFNSEWEYPKEVWECTCAVFYVPRERGDVNDYWSTATATATATATTTATATATATTKGDREQR